MKGYYIVKSKSNNYYLYSVTKRKLINLTFDEAHAIENGYSNAYVSNLKNEGYLEDYSLDFSGRLLKEDIEQSIANTRQVTFEITDDCNLECYYCAYGHFYNNYDRRNSKYMDFHTAKGIVDFIKEKLLSNKNISFKKDIVFSFYGGEPLMNMNLIKRIVSYIQDELNNNFTFSFQMTTNALLLDKHIDFLVKNNFSLLISLDGDKNSNEYRKLKNGCNSYDVIYNNILKLKEMYPEFFDSKVNFNAVLHNKNSVTDLHNFFNEHFGKIPDISEINTQGIDIKKTEEFYALYRNTEENLGQIEDYRLKNPEIDLSLKNAKIAIQMLDELGGYSYNDFKQLKYGKSLNEKFRLTGTCLPGEISLFFTVNGKILPCERIGQNLSFGCVEDGVVNIDYQAVAAYYNSRYDKLESICMNCYRNISCGQCFYYLNFNGENLSCNGFSTYKDYKDELTWLVNYLEKNPTVYKKYRKEIMTEY